MRHQDRLFKALTSLLGMGVYEQPVFAESTQSVSEVFTRAESVSFSAANPLTAYLNALIGPAPRDGSYVVSRNVFEAGYRHQQFEVGFIHRNDYNLYFSPDAARFAYLNKNAKPIPRDQRYRVDVRANQYQLTGAKVGYSLPITESVELFGYYAQYQATESVYGYLGKSPDGSGGDIAMVDVQLGGSTVPNLDGNLYTRYHYVDDPLFEREVKDVTGSGYSVDLGIRWQILPNLSAKLVVQDLLGEINWSNMPVTEAVATSDIVTVDEDGVLHVRPSFEGVHGFDDLTQKLVRREQISFDYRYKNYLLAYQYDKMKVVTFHRLTAGYFWHQDWGISGSFDAKSQSMGLKVHTRAGNVFVSMDNLEIDNAYSLAFGWNFSLRL